MKEIFDTYFRRVVLFCNGLLKNMEDAEDIAVETFVELYKRYDKSRTEAEMRTFLFLVSKNKCLNQLKRKNKIITCELNNDFIDHAEINAIVIDKLYQEISKEVEHLPWRQKEIAKLILSGFTTEEISSKLGISYSTVNNLKWIVTSKLRTNLKWYMKQYVYLD